MSLSIGIVGLPNVGKSTLFKALTNKQVDIQNYPFTTINPNIGVVAVPDKRVDALAVMSNSKKKIYATVDFIDIAGLVKGAAQGEGLGNKFLANIREVDAVAQVVRAFPNPPGQEIIHVHNRVSPDEDLEIINTELVIADLDTVSKRIEKTGKEARSQNKKATVELEQLNKFKSCLEGGGILSGLSLNEEERLLAKELNLLTSKPFIYVVNVSEDQFIDGYTPDEALVKSMSETPYVVMCNKLELSLSESTPDEKKQFMSEFNLPESGLDRLIKTGYETLGLLTFLTTGEDETRAWTAHIGDPIPLASRAVHTDFEKLFIRAEVINWKELLETGSYGEARAKGLLKTVGRDYIIQEGDVVEIKI